jgi:chromosomal replication initiator protein
MPAYSFESFVVGTASQDAFDKAVAVAGNPGQAPNPLVLYGPTRSGKTHLLYAIERTMRSRRPEAKIRRIPTADFIDELVDAIRRDKTPRFRQSLADLDALLLDDIRLRGKTQTMKEILHNLNDVLNRGAQVVVTCDVPPRRVPLLDQWLRSHADVGLAVAIG